MTREEVQKAAVNAAIKNKCSGILDLSPRTGKSKIAIDILKTLHPSNKILITVPYNSIIESWETEILKWNYTESNIKIINKRGLSKEDLSIYNLIVVDEIHDLSDNESACLYQAARTILGLTGSLGEDNRKALKRNLGLKIIYKYSIEEAINDGIIADFKVNLHYVELDNTVKNIEYGVKAKPMIGTELEAYKWFTGQFERFRVLSFSNPSLNVVKMKYAGKRKEIVYKSINKLSKSKELIKDLNYCLIFTGLIETANKLSKNTYTSKSKGTELEDFKSGKIKKLAVIAMSSMGVTIPKLKNIVCHQLQSTEELAMQKLLRAMNLDKDKVANIDIVIAKNTVDEDWMNKALAFIPEDKITRHY